jgi:hypothetical protein
MAGRSKRDRGRSVPADSTPTTPIKAKKKGVGGGGSGGGGADKCALSFSTPLNSPDLAVVKALKDGDKLRVEVRKGSPYPSVVCVVPSTGKVAGSLATATELPELIECHAEGNRYEARVMGSKKPPIVRVYRISKP